MLKIKSLHPDFKMPIYATAGAAGFDLYAIQAGRCSPGLVEKTPLGFAVAVPEGHAMLVTTRSGHGAKYGAGVPHGYGLIDSDYRGEIFMVLTTEKPFSWEKGERIGQAMIVPYVRVPMALVEELDDTERGTGGFGSTGTR